ncbi:MAG TPA: hypothetical protein VLV16_01420 [Gemmatimonadales bacterium]|nr:hypothetical protein [Gemmatimonadales bacterium]
MKWGWSVALAIAIAAPAFAQSPVRPVPAADSSVARSWTHEGTWVGAVTGGLAFGVGFYHFTHRTGAPNTAAGDLGGALVGTAIGAAGGALLGAFVGALIPKHKPSAEVGTRN